MIVVMTGTDCCEKNFWLSSIDLWDYCEVVLTRISLPVSAYLGEKATRYNRTVVFNLSRSHYYSFIKPDRSSTRLDVPLLLWVSLFNLLSLVSLLTQSLAPLQSLQLTHASMLVKNSAYYCLWNEMIHLKWDLIQNSRSFNHRTYYANIQMPPMPYPTLR